DINFAQYQFLNQLLSPAKNLCVIGDPDQAIYGFRGAKREFFLKFQKDFPQAKVVNLNKNYRSTQLILDASSQMISKSLQKKSTHMWSDFVSQTKVEIYNAATDKAEAEYVVHQIEIMMGGTSYFSLDSGRVGVDDNKSESSFADFAVLYRLNVQSKLLEKAFQRSGIPYQTVGQTPFFEHKVIKELLSYLWVLYNPHSDYYLKNIFTHSQNGISEATIVKIMAHAQQHGMSCWEVLQNPETLQYSDFSQRQSIFDFVNSLKNLISASKRDSVTGLIELVIKSNFTAAPFKANDSQRELMQQLILKSKPFENRLGAFLEASVLQKETDEYDLKADRVMLMTIHAAKGLEFPVVFVVGCEENLIPYHRAGEVFDVDEERRLFYVGMTRAKQKLILTHAKTRFLFGQSVQNAPSRFLSDIENTLKEVKQTQYLKKRKESKNTSQTSLF
ncbi:MAG: ATP-dependent helicase, partial [bacterium]